jgi:tetratricopeptide (TPR) repeat protein
MYRVLAVIGALALIGVTPPLHAEPAHILAQPANPKPGSKEAKRLAKQHFETAKKLYRSGSYREAIVELDQAIELDPDAKDLHFNRGLVHEKVGEIDLAIVSFRRFTELETDPAELERVIQIIHRLEGARDKVKKEEPVVAPPPPKDEPKSPGVVIVERDKTPTPREEKKKGRLDGWVYVTGGAAIVAFGVGTYFGVKALQTRPKSDEATGPDHTVYELEDRARRAHDYAITADIAIGMGLALGGAAALFYFTRDAKPKAQPQVGATLGPRSGGLSLGSAF